MTTDQIEHLYPAAPAPGSGSRPGTSTGACPEAGLSLCLKGRLRGLDAQVTIRGKDRQEFYANLLGVLDLSSYGAGLAALFDGASLPAAAANGTQEARPEGWCGKHGVAMQENHKDGRTWWSHRLQDGTWCKGR